MSETQTILALLESYAAALNAGDIFTADRRRFCVAVAVTPAGDE